jgi:hypothetical protein
MVDLIRLRRSGEDDIQVFAALEDLRVYTKETARFFPKDSLAAGCSARKPSSGIIRAFNNVRECQYGCAVLQCCKSAANGHIPAQVNLFSVSGLINHSSPLLSYLRSAFTLQVSGAEWLGYC